MIVGVGMDIVDVARVARLLAVKGDRALLRLCTPAEADYIRARHGGAASLAARLAAKEAAFKALAGSEDARGIGGRDVEVVKDWAGRPSVQLHGRAERRAADLGVARIHLSMTHTSTSAAAVVVLESAS